MQRYTHTYKSLKGNFSDYIENKLSSAGIGSKKLSSDGNSSEKLSSLTQFILTQKSQLREAQLSNSVLTQISLAQDSQLRVAQLPNSILTKISFAQKSL